MAGQDHDDIAAALRRIEQSSSAQRDDLESLARTARKRLGVGAVRISRRGIWGFGRLESAQFILGDHNFRVTIRGGKVTSEIGDAIGGVGLTPTSVPWPEWCRRLIAEIDATIEQNP